MRTSAAIAIEALPAAVNFSAGSWLADAAKVIAEARAQHRVPIFVGGSGLYFKALTRGLSAVPPIPPEIRESVRGRLERSPEGVLNLVADRLQKLALTVPVKSRDFR